MVKKKTTKRQTRAIVTGYLEKVNASVFDKFKHEITEMTKGHQGLYALYRRNKLYYLGLASNLRNRIKHHLNDRHQGKWSHFSLYIIRKEGHIRELESLMLRIAYPEGNSQRGKLKRSEDLLPQLKRQIKKKIHDEYVDLFKHSKGGSKKTVTKKLQKTSKQAGKKNRPLQSLFPGGKMIYATYQGKAYKAWVSSSGVIKLLPSKKCFDSPSAAGIAVVKRKTVNGWTFWKYKNESGELVRLTELRKNK